MRRAKVISPKLRVRFFESGEKITAVYKDDADSKTVETIEAFTEAEIHLEMQRIQRVYGGVIRRETPIPPRMKRFLQEKHEADMAEIMARPTDSYGRPLLYDRALSQKTVPEKGE